MSQSRHVKHLHHHLKNCRLSHATTSSTQNSKDDRYNGTKRILCQKDWRAQEAIYQKDWRRFEAIYQKDSKGRIGVRNRCHGMHAPASTEADC